MTIHNRQPSVFRQTIKQLGILDIPLIAVFFVGRHTEPTHFPAFIPLTILDYGIGL